METAFLIGRLIFGGYWLMAAVNHFKNLAHMTENIALIGALLMYLLLPRPWPMSLGIG